MPCIHNPFTGQVETILERYQRECAQEATMLTVNQRLALERVIIKNLIQTMAAHGWHVDHIWDGEQEVRNSELGAQLDAIFAVDESQIIFENPQGRQHWVSLILGNGIDVISDYSTALHKADNFEAVMLQHVNPFVTSLEATQ